MPLKDRANEHPLVVVRVVVVRQSDEDILLISQEVESATIERHLCIGVAGCNVGIAVVTQLRYCQFVLNAHVVTSLLTLTLPLRIVVTTPVGLTISRS